MIKRSSPPLGLRAVAILAAALVALAATACTDNDATPTASGSTPTATASGVGTGTATEPASTTQAASPTPTATDGTGTDTGTASATASLTATPEDDPDKLALLRRNLVSSLTTGLTPDETRDALEDIEVVTVALVIEEREVWIAATSGSGIYSLPESREHVARGLRVDRRPRTDGRTQRHVRAAAVRWFRPLLGRLVVQLDAGRRDRHGPGWRCTA